MAAITTCSDFGAQESWEPKNWCFWTVVLEKTLESALDCKEIQPVHPKEISPGCSLEGLMLKLTLQYFGHLMRRKSWLIGKDPDSGRDWGQEKKGTTEDEMAVWHHWLDGHEFEWTPGVGDRQGGLVCCDSWGCKELDTTEWLNWTESYIGLWNAFFSSLHLPFLCSAPMGFSPVPLGE